MLTRTVPSARASKALLQRTSGLGRFSVKVDPGGRTGIERLHQQGAGKVRFPRQFPGETALEAVLINTAGGVTGGDRLDWEIGAGINTRLSVTTQANEKVYKADEGVANIGVRLNIADSASLAWLPQETILFNESALERHIDVDMAASSSLLMLEAVVFGRLGYGERVREGHFRDRWRVRVGGRLVHAEETAFDGAIENMLGEAAIANGDAAVASLLMVGRVEAGMIDALRNVIAATPEIRGGVSEMEFGSRPGTEDRQTGKLLARLTAKDGYDLRKGLYPLVRLLNSGAGLPKSWAL